MLRETFGLLDDGTAVERVLISSGSLSAWILTYGGIIQDLRLAGHPHALVLGFNEFDHYRQHSPYFGAIVGRCANRIAMGRALIDDRVVVLDRNDNNRHMLHGGSDGISQRNWQINDYCADSVSLSLQDPDGHMGFPGNCAVRCDYTIIDDSTLQIRLGATSDQPTLCNLAQHNYFNLDGGASISDHELRINARRYLPVDEQLIPTGEIASVDGTAFDFGEFRPVHRPATPASQQRFDLNYCLSERTTGTSPYPLQQAAQLWSPHSDIAMTLSSTEPGLQFYDGHGVKTPVAGLMGEAYGASAGLCLESQGWPDAANHPHFPSVVLRPGDSYRQISQFAFTKGQPQ